MKAWHLIFAGVVAGIFAGALVLGELSAAREKTEAVSVFRLKASADGISPGQRIRLSDLEEIPVPRNFVEFLDIAVRANASTRTWLDDKIVSRPIPAGSILTRDKLLLETAERFDQRISPGARALTLRVDLTNSVNKKIAPGFQIDVLGDVGGITPESEAGLSDYLLRNVSILAVGDATSYRAYLDIAERGYSTITIEVCEREARRFAYLRSRLAGEITVTLRNQDEPLSSRDCT